MNWFGRELKFDFDSDGLFGIGINISEKVDEFYNEMDMGTGTPGYERAASEYEKVYKAIEKEYKETEKILTERRDSDSEMKESLISQLESLEKQSTELNRHRNNKAKEVSQKYNIPVHEITKSLMEGTLLWGNDINVEILDIIDSHNAAKIDETGSSEYADVKKLYEKKIEKLRESLQYVKIKATEEIQKLMNLISDLMEEITKCQMEIAELQVLL